MSKYWMNIEHKDSTHGEVKIFTTAKEALDYKRKMRDQGCKVEIRRVKA